MKLNRGFTLLEVLMAAALIGLAAVTAVAISLSSDYFFRSSTSGTKVQDEAALAMERIMRDLRRGYVARINPNSTPSSIFIYTDPVYSSNYNSIRRIKYRLWPGTTNLRRYPETNAPNNGWGGNYEVISRKITNLTFTEVPDPLNPNRINIRINLTAEDQEKSLALESTATLLYRPTTYPWE